MKNAKVQFADLKNLGKALCLPLGMFLIVELVCRISISRNLFETSIDITNFFKSCGVTIISAYALSINMSSGRMDLSLGAQKMVGCLIGGNIALQLGLGPWGTLLFSVLFGILAGLVVGAIFISIRMPAMVLGIGMALVFEALSVAFANEGFQLYGQSNMGLLGNAWFISLFALICMIFMILLMQHSKFGYHYSAIRGSQRVAISSGINVFGNALICYAICGGMISLAGVLETGYLGYFLPALNMSSTTIAFSGFVPVFLAMTLQRYCHLTIAIPISVVTFRFLSMGISLFRLPAAASSVITMGILLLFLIATGQFNRNKAKKALQKRGEEAAVLRSAV